MPLPRQRQQGGDFLPFFLWAVKQSGRLPLAVLASLLLHALVLALPSAHHGASTAAGRMPAKLEVRFASTLASAPQSALTAVEAPADRLSAAEYEDGNSPLESSGAISESRYFDSSEVDLKAEPIELAPLVYPEAAYIRRLPGIVKMRVYISASGTIDAVDVVSADPPDLFERAALDALLKTRFKPAELFGHPVASVKTVSVNFDPHSDRPAP